jgi:hypothetical protein
MLYLEGVRIAPRAHRRWMEIGLAGAFLVGLATLQGEFDFGVPQFRMLYQPVLLAIAAGVGLVAARVRLGRGGAIGAVCVFVAIRGTLAILVTPILGRSVPHFPLFIVEALVVEVVASVVPDDRPLRFGALAGLLIGTVGFAGEWVWSHIWMPLPWQPTLLPEGIVLVPLAGVAAGLLGALIGRALAGDPIALRPVRRSVVVFAGVVLVAAVAWPLPTDGGHDLRADVSLTDLTSGPQRTAQATIRLQPADAADDNDFFTVTAWQGANWTRQHVVIDRLQQISRGVWRTTQPIPVYGKWKALIRLQNGRTLAATPMFMPEDAGIPAPEVSAPAEFNRPFVPDKQLLQREFTGGPGWLEAAAYTVLLAIAVGWVWLIGWGLQRLLSDSRGNDRDSVPAIASSSGRERVPAGVG